MHKRFIHDDPFKIAFLSLPKVVKKESGEWTTSIKIKYKDSFLDDIKKQLNSIQDEVLLFVNYINKLRVEIDGKQKTIERIKDKTNIYLNDKLWTIFDYKEDSLLPKEYWKNDEEEHFDLKIAVKENFDIRDKYLLYSYFPTEINIDFPFIIHGTFELDSSRNNINNSTKNSYILDKLVNFIANTAKELTKNEVNYRALEFLTHESSNQRLKILEFYNKVDEKINELSIFPCLDNTYKSKKEVVFLGNDFSEFVQINHFEGTFPNMLISNQKSSININNYDISKEIDLSLIDEVSSKIKDVNLRAKIIYLVYQYFKSSEYVFELLIDEDNETISKEEEAYTPKFENMNKLVLPSFLNEEIKFLHKQLGSKLLNIFGIQDKKSYRELANKLSDIVSLKEYETATILERIISETKKLNTIQATKEMIEVLYKNFKIKEIQIETKNIPCISKDMQIVYTNNLFLSDSYPSGQLTEFLFGDIFDKNHFLINDSIFDFQNSEAEEIENFFLWLGVNKISKMVSSSDLKKRNYCYNYFNSINGKPDYADHMTLAVASEIYNFDTIVKEISIEKFIVWCLQDENIYNSFNRNELVTLRGSRGGYINQRYCKISFVHHLILASNIFKDYLITNEKLSLLVNNINIDFESEIFKKYKIKKSDIESLVLKIGAVEKFEEISIIRVREILKNFESKSPDGKQTQTIYKGVRNHKDKLNDKSIMLCAKQDAELSYYNQDEVYYASSVKLPKKILSNLPIINVPPRLGNIVSFFGIKDTKEIKITIDLYEENASLTKKFHNLFFHIQSFILVHRFDNLNDDEKQKTLTQLKNSQIVLCDKVTYQMNGKNYELEDNDYIKDDKKYYIKVKNESVDKIRKTLDFRETFSDIIGSIFNIINVKKYERLISDDINETEEIIKRELGYEALLEVREYLNMADEFSTFYRIIYKLKDKNFNEKYKLENIDIIKEELNISTNLEKLDYTNIANDNSCMVLQNLLEELDISIKDFNEENLHLKIDFTNYHQKKLKNCFNDNYNKFEKILYQWCLSNNKKDKFISLKGKYEHADKKVENHLHLNYKARVESFIESNFGFTLEDEESTIDFNKLYDCNILNFDIGELSTFEKSLLYFEGGIEQVTNNFKLNINNGNENKGISDSTEDNTIPTNINNISVRNSTPPIKTNQNNNYGTYNPSNERKQKQQGDKAEQCVFNYLVKTYQKVNVKWFSKESDSGHYDIRYKKEAKWIYVEVKTFSNSMFYISKDEKEFAENNKENYEIFLVEIFPTQNCENAKIRILNYEELKKLKFIANKYEVYYSIED